MIKFNCISIRGILSALRAFHIDSLACIKKLEIEYQGGRLLIFVFIEVHTFVLNMHEYFAFNLYFVTLLTGSAFNAISLLIMPQNPFTCSRNVL